MRRPLPSNADVIVLCSGEPAGIGPDICAQIATQALPVRLAVLGDPDVIAARARQLALDVRVQACERVDDVGPHEAGVLALLPVAAAAPVVAGRLDPSNAAYVLDILRRGVELCRNRNGRALVTAPVQKSVICEAGVPFSGHTEFLAKLTGADQPVMMLAGKTLRVALATTHLPLRQVAGALDAARLEKIVTITHDALARFFDVEAPRLLVLGLNPHAGESGTLGPEEREIIEPVVRRLAAAGMRVSGPAPADTAFTAESLAGCDAVVAMYHDQGLPALKALSFGTVVNVTLGLPLVRTSVDHGTALALAGTGRASPASLLAAVHLAADLARRAGA